MADSIIIAVVCLVLGAVVGFASQPRVDKPHVRQVATPEPVGATVAEIVQFKQAGRQKGGKRR